MSAAFDEPADASSSGINSQSSVVGSQVNSGKLKPQGLRKNGKLWHDTTTRKPFRPLSSEKSSVRHGAFAKRQALRASHIATKAIEKEMKEAKEAERKAQVDRILNRRKEKQEKERQRIIDEKMSVRRRERLKRKEKRNKLLNS